MKFKNDRQRKKVMSIIKNLEREGWKVKKIDETKNYLRFRQQNPNKFDRFRIVDPGRKGFTKFVLGIKDKGTKTLKDDEMKVQSVLVNKKDFGINNVKFNDSVEKIKFPNFTLHKNISKNKISMGIDLTGKGIDAKVKVYKNGVLNIKGKNLVDVFADHRIEKNIAGKSGKFKRFIIKFNSLKDEIFITPKFSGKITHEDTYGPYKSKKEFVIDNEFFIHITLGENSLNYEILGFR